MLKLDPDDGDSDADESRDKTMLNISASSDGVAFSSSAKNSHSACDGYSLTVTVSPKQENALT